MIILWVTVQYVTYILIYGPIRDLRQKCKILKYLNLTYLFFIPLPSVVNNCIISVHIVVKRLSIKNGFWMLTLSLPLFLDLSIK